jgi:hypothetical protein
MNRREFLVRAGTFAAIPIVIQVVGCGEDDSSPTGQPTDRLSFSATLSGHSHTGVITCTQLNGGVDVTVTSSSGGSPVHNHTFTVTMQQLATLMSGGTVTISTSSAGHPHDWSISRPAGVCP